MTPFYYLRHLPIDTLSSPDKVLHPYFGIGDLVRIPATANVPGADYFHKVSAAGVITIPADHCPPLRPVRLILCCSRIIAGSNVWWNDPEDETSAYYTVTKIGAGDSQTYEQDTIILLNNEISEAEVLPAEIDVVVGPIVPAIKWANTCMEFSEEEWRWSKDRQFIELFCRDCQCYHY